MKGRLHGKRQESSCSIVNYLTTTGVATVYE
jgi:hypothetical protein